MTSDVSRHPLVLATWNQASDVQQAAAREAVQVDARVATALAASSDDPEAARDVIRQAAVALGTAYVRYAPMGSGYIVPGAERFDRWFHRHIVAVRGAAIRCLGADEGAKLVCIPWRPVP